MALNPIPMWSIPRRIQMPVARPPGSNAPPWLQKVHGGLGKLLGANQQNPYLSQQEQEAARQRQLFASAAAMLQNSGPRPQGTSNPLGAIGTGIQAGQQAQDQYTADALRARLIAAQMANTNQERAEPAQVRIARILADPTTPQAVKDDILAQREASQSGDISDFLRAQLLGVQLRNETRESDEAEASAAASRTTQRNAIVRGLEQTGKIADLTKSLEGTFLEAGAPASDWRRTGLSALASVGGALGFDTSKQRETVANFDRLKKNTNDQLINLMSTGNLGESTNAKLAQYQSSLASPDVSPAAIMDIQASIAELLLSQADAEGYDVPNRAEIERRIEEMRSYASPAPAPAADVPGAVNTASNIAKMGIEQLQSLNLAEMSDEALEAARKRWNELNE